MEDGNVGEWPALPSSNFASRRGNLPFDTLVGTRFVCGLPQNLGQSHRPPTQQPYPFLARHACLACFEKGEPVDAAAETKDKSEFAER